MQIKLDELIHAIKGANNALLDLEQLDGKTLDRIRQLYLDKAAAARGAMRAAGESTPDQDQ